MIPRGWTRANLVPNAPIRAAYLAYRRQTGLSACDICDRLGWNRKDTSRLHRRLGLMKQRVSHTPQPPAIVQHNVDRRIAEALCRVMGIDFDVLYDGWLPVQEPAGLCRYCSWELLEPDAEETCGFCKWELESFGRVDSREAA